MATGMSACMHLAALIARDRSAVSARRSCIVRYRKVHDRFFTHGLFDQRRNPGRFGNSPNGSPTVGLYERPTAALHGLRQRPAVSTPL